MNVALRVAAETTLNSQQRAAYEQSGSIVILAGPGSGKTRLLTLKLARIAAEDLHPPRLIACITYSNECVRELRGRLSRLGLDTSSSLYLGTVHAFCLQHILIPYGTLAGLTLPYPLKVASDGDQARAFGNAVRAVRMGSTSELRKNLNDFRRTQLDSKTWPASNPLSELARAYESALFDAGAIDFDAIVRNSVDIVEQHAWVRHCIRARFPILVVDEYQDLGTALHRLVEALCLRTGIRLIAVGDPDQSIYGFAGARPEHLLGLADDSGVTCFRLEMNYRSATQIVAAAKAALPVGVNYSADSKDAGIVEFHTCSNGVEGEAQHLTGVILPSVLQRYEPRDVLIGFRSKIEGATVERELKKAGHEYVKIGSTSEYQHTPLTRSIEHIARWCSSAAIETNERISDAIRQWLSLQRTVDSELLRNERIKLIRFMFRHRNANDSASSWLDAFDAQVMSTDDTRTRLVTFGETDAYDDLRNSLRPGGNLQDFTVRNLGGQLGSSERLNLVTLHSSKSTEYPVVVLVGLDEGSFPWNVPENSIQEHEARRLFYVGISRAQKELHVLSSRPVPGDKRHQGPSRFVRQMRSKMAP